jgi:pimeloyl-ACP methyl ester carboxylesterase
MSDFPIKDLNDPITTNLIDQFELKTILVNQVEFSLIEMGPSSGELALCLHGFPDTAFTWRYLLPELASQGYRAVAPFQRGYWPTKAPENASYQTGALVKDACSLHDYLSPGKKGVIIGHDWGAFAAYGACAWRPEAWRKAVTCAVPPVAAMANAFFSFEQLKRSWYMFFFQVPLAEAAFSMNDLEMIAKLWADWSPGYDASQDLVHVKNALRNDENLSSALGYYRAMFDPSKHDASLSQEQSAVMMPTPQPLLYIHGRDDGCLSVDLAKSAQSYLTGESQMHIIEGAGHFMNVEKPQEFNAKVLEFLGPAQPGVSLE